MIERLKSLLIVLLSIFSVLLLLLNFGIRPSDFSYFKKDKSTSTIFQSNAILEDAVKPESIGINFSKSEHTYITNPEEEDIWRSASNILREVFSGETEGKIKSVDQVTKTIYNQFLDQKSVVLFFEKQISLVTLLNGLGIEGSENIDTNFEALESIYISIDKDFIIISDQERTILLTIEDVDKSSLSQGISTLKELGYNPYTTIKKYLGVNRIGYIPIIENQKLKKVSFTNILNKFTEENIDNIVNNFFGKEVNYLREIKEEGQQTIYVDGDRILKISEGGLISYFNPEELRDKDRNLFISLDTALSFMSNNLGYDSSFYLKKITPINIEDYSGFRMLFGKSSNSHEVKADTAKVSEYVELDVYNDHVRRFYQLFRGENLNETEEEYIEIPLTNELKPFVYKRVNEINSKLFPDKDNNYSFEEILAKIEKADLVYIDRGMSTPLGIGWQIKIGNTEFLFPLD